VKPERSPVAEVRVDFDVRIENRTVAAVAKTVMALSGPGHLLVLVASKYPVEKLRLDRVASFV
jgi:hypothetical protein